MIAIIRSYARAKRPGFLLIAQNGVDLVEREPRLLDLIDGLAQEDLSFSGRADARWREDGAGDVPAPLQGPWSTEALAMRLQATGLPVLTLDYAVRPDNVALARERSTAYGFVPFVSQTPLDRLPGHVMRRDAPARPR